MSKMVDDKDLAGGGGGRLTEKMSKMAEHSEGRQEHAHWARTEVVDWMLKVGAHFGFTALTVILSINYLDRFLSSKNTHQIIKDDNKPSWMIKLVDVTCLSLAAKVEETHVPLLVDLQVCIKQ
ncbi:hypothetical protein RJ640_001730 [Escallonia rubra]|uniref:Cyclin N-terminal domain-containing protein n=1 Tax=Escallonia rubra TaxID=112253 RepID=A0AA88U9R9_9ASTE|nr:hypothetical protein RJ640_001730 [Escallonia rubra]